MAAQEAAEGQAHAPARRRGAGAPPRRRRCSSARSGRSHPAGARGSLGRPQRAGGGRGRRAPGAAAGEELAEAVSVLTVDLALRSSHDLGLRDEHEVEAAASPSRAPPEALAQQALGPVARSTAPPSRRLTARPSRSCSAPLSAAEATSTKSAPSTRFPPRRTRRNSAPRRSRWRGREAPPGGTAARLQAAEALAPLLAAPLQHEAAALGPHAHQEAVRPLPLPVVRLERPLHVDSSFAASGRPAGPRCVSRARAKLKSRRHWRLLSTRAPGAATSHPCLALGRL